MIYEYGCPNCKKEFDIMKSVADFDRLEYCECGAEMERLFRPNPNNIFKSSGIAESPTYNPGLGEIVKSKAHLKELCKIKGVEPIGNEKPETVHRHYDKSREEKLEKNWEEPSGWMGNGE